MEKRERAYSWTFNEATVYVMYDKYINKVNVFFRGTEGADAL